MNKLLIIGFWSSFLSGLSDSLTISLPLNLLSKADFYQKKFKPLELILFDDDHILDHLHF